MIIYCSHHRENHKLTDRDAEDLIHGLIADFVDAAMDNEVRPGFEREFGDGVTQTYGECPIALLHDYRDGETYGEHLESMRESRLAAAGDTDNGGEGSPPTCLHGLTTPHSLYSPKTNAPIDHCKGPVT